MVICAKGHPVEALASGFSCVGEAVPALRFLILDLHRWPCSAQHRT